MTAMVCKIYIKFIHCLENSTDQLPQAIEQNFANHKEVVGKTQQNEMRNFFIDHSNQFT